MTTRQATFRAHDHYVLDLVFSPDSRTLISSGMDKQIKLWTAPNWDPQGTWEGHANSVNSISLSPDGRTLASGSTDTTVKLWSWDTGKVLHTLRDRKKVVAAVQIAPTGDKVAAASYAGRLAIWTLEGQEILGIKASQKNLAAIAFAPSGDHIAIAGLGDNIQIRSVPGGEQIATLVGHKTAVISMVFINQGQHLLSLGYEGTLRLWDTASWQTLETFKTGAGTRGLAVAPDEKSVAFSQEGRVDLLAVGSWTFQAELAVGTKVITGMAFSPDGRWFAAGAADKRIRVWEQA